MTRLAATVGVVVILAAGPAATTAAQESGDPGSEPGRNLMFTITAGNADDPARTKSYRLVARDGDGPARMLLGWRMPIPASVSASAEDDAPTTSYVYHNVGVTTTLEARTIARKTFLVRAQIEISGKREAQGAAGAEAGLPIIGTFQQDVNVVLKEGRVLRVAEVPDPEEGTLYLELKVEALE